MAGINSILNSASSSIVAQRVAMEVTGENIANVNTPGYSRQRAILVTAPVTSTTGFPLGNGVLVKSVQRFYDAVLQKNIADGNSSLQNNQTRLTSLQAVEPSFNDVTTDGLGKSIQDFFDSWQALSVNASGTPERQAVLSRAQVMVDNFQQINQTLRNVQTNADRTMDGIAADITLKAKSIASLNDQINQTELIGASSSELRDQRDYLARELAKKVGAVFTEELNGTLTVRMSDGSTLVEDNRYATVYTNALTVNPPDLNKVSPSNHILITVIGNPPKANSPTTDSDITSTIGGTNNSKGEIGAMLALRDTVIPDYLQKVDELAYNLANQVNEQHKLGWNLNNAVGSNFFSFSGAPNTITGIDTTGLNAGETVLGTGIPAGTTIARIDGPTQITLNPPLMQSIVSGATFTFPTSLPNTITNINTVGLNVGDAVWTGGVDTGTTIARIDSATQFTLSAPLSNSVASGATFTFNGLLLGRPGDAIRIQTGTATGIAGYSSASSRGISLNITSISEIAAADTNPLTGGSGNNINALALAAIKDLQVPFTTGGGASSSVLSYYNAMVSSIGVDVQAAQNSSDQSESYVTQLNNLRESISGVSLDEEMTNLIRYQKAFQGAAKMITTATEMIDIVLGMVR